ncbi:hypothetical protein ACHAP5_010917 [Fusarium lateritium]
MKRCVHEPPEKRGLVLLDRARVTSNKTTVRRSSTGVQISETATGCAISPIESAACEKGPSTETDYDDDVVQGKPMRSWYRQYRDQKLAIRTLLTRKFQEWSTGVAYTAPPSGYPFSRDYSKAACRELGFAGIEEDDGTSDNELVVVSHPDYLESFYHLACPFYVYDPTRYRRCLVQDSLKSVKSVVEHLVQCHSRFPYCPVCYGEFDSWIDRDNHLLNDICEVQNLDPSDGLMEDQKVLLINGDYTSLDEKSSWRFIWSIVFPDSEQPISIYLDRKCGLRASMAIDFWDRCGTQIIFDFFRQQDVCKIPYKGSHDVLNDLILEDLLDFIIESYDF